MVLKQSSPSKKPSTVVVPVAMEPNITERCETDLSPGTVSDPCIDGLLYCKTFSLIHFPLQYEDRKRRKADAFFSMKYMFQNWHVFEYMLRHVHGHFRFGN